MSIANQFHCQIVLPLLAAHAADEATLSSLHNVISTHSTLSQDTDYSHDEINLYAVFPELREAMHKKLRHKYMVLVAKLEQDARFVIWTWKIGCTLTS